MPNIKETLNKFDEKFNYPYSLEVDGDWQDGVNMTEVKCFIKQEIKTALESIRNIELAPDEKTIKDLQELNNKSEAFGYGQGFVCRQLDKNIENYLKTNR